MDWSQCPMVEINPKIQSGAPVLRETRMQVAAILDSFEYGVSIPARSTTSDGYGLVKVGAARP